MMMTCFRSCVTAYGTLTDGSDRSRNMEEVSTGLLEGEVSDSWACMRLTFWSAPTHPGSCMISALFSFSLDGQSIF